MTPGLSLVWVLALGGASGLSDYEKALCAYWRQDYRETFRLMQHEAELGKPDAAYYLGKLYSRGLGVQQNDVNSEQWFQNAFESYLASAKAADMRSQSRLCFMYFSGRGTAQSYIEALNWCERAAQGGDPTAQENLARMYEHGYGVLQDLAKSTYWQSKAQERREYEDSGYRIMCDAPLPGDGKHDR